jgi:shikimate dehydrogenase
VSSRGPAYADRTVDIGEIATWQGQPLITFLGVSTSGSLAHDAFPHWAEILSVNWALRGVDLPVRSPHRTYRTWLENLRDNPAVVGAVITAHKLSAYDAGTKLFVARDLYSALAHEVNAVSSEPGGLSGFARDPLSLSHLLPTLVADPPRRVICFGAGGAATALLLACLTLVASSEAGGRLEPQPDPPDLVFVDVDESALHALGEVARSCAVPGISVRLQLLSANSPAVVRALDAAAPGDLVVNATGLGKERPGSPVTGALPPGVVAWDLNYRGPLSFLCEARRAGAVPVDGWEYFVAGWAGALTAIASVPLTADLLARFGAAAAHLRPRESRSAQTGRASRGDC